MKPLPAACSIAWPISRSAVQIVHFEADDGEQVGLAEELLRVGQAHEGHGRVVLIKAGVEDAGDAEALVLGREAERRQLALRAGDQHAVAHLRADGLGQIVAQHQRRIGRVDLSLRPEPVALLLRAPGSRSFAEPEVMVSSRLLTVRSSAGMMPLISAKPARGPRETSTCP